MVGVDDLTQQPAPPEDKVIVFEDGIPGFSTCRRFVLVDLAPDSAFQTLQSVDDPDIRMIVTVPWLFFPEYSLELSEMEERSLEVQSPEDVVVLCTVVLVPEERSRVFLNLMGPFVVNARTRRGCQLVLAGSGYELRAPVTLPEVPA